MRVDNSAVADVAPLSADYTFFGGIYRDVSLVALDPLSVRMDDFGGPGVYLTQRLVTAEAAQVDVVTKAHNASGGSRSVRVRTVLSDARGREVSRVVSPPASISTDLGVSQRLSLSRPHRWQGTADPHL
ncbi:hypothetical protein [Amycolatopsis sp. FDAARGOS 1241]|uniref:hypothetical protein n=1 Tax=Amycolatopsis sp. FDAARGOS 1241 TaxID=2778070 RepID=UPI0019528369|nr:hypothetical protein [Amycolatopsis sp. FDAARGOS 1241]QRP47608.1 hypothetical protein I6J71_06595 [Amycolatopsis sp. FDAARGOS 1241]